MKTQIAKLLKTLVKQAQTPSKRGKTINKEIKITTKQIITIIEKKMTSVNQGKCKMCKECDCQRLFSGSDEKSMENTDIEQTQKFIEEGYDECSIGSIQENEYFQEITEISMLNLIGQEYSLEYNPTITMSKYEAELLELNRSEKYSKYFNSKLLFQKYQAEENYFKSGCIKREFGFVFINNGKLIMKLFINVKGVNYKVLIKSRNKRFKDIQGFDYFSDLSYNELFFLCIIKYIVHYNRKDKIRLFQYFITSLDIYNNKSLFTTDSDNCFVNPALNLDKARILNFKHSYLREDALEFIVEGLSYSINVVEIIFEENKIGDEGAFLIAKALKSPVSNLKTLGLSYNVIGEDGAKALSEALNNNKKLKAIGLYNNNIGNLGAQALGSMFLNNESLESINLSKNIFGFDGLRLLLEGLYVNTKLKVIGLEFLNISDRGGGLFKDLLIRNQHIEGINLSNNSIGDNGFSKICEGLIQNSKLTALSIRRNSIGDKGAVSLSNALLKNKTLKLIFLQENSICNEGGRNLLDSVKLSQSIEEIYLYENCIQYDLKVVIRADEKRIKL